MFVVRIYVVITSAITVVFRGVLVQRIRILASATEQKTDGAQTTL